MWKLLALGLSVAMLGTMLAAGIATAQHMQRHDRQMQHGQALGQASSGQSAVPTSPGQDAFGAIQEMVRILEADPTTDWSRVNLERLRQRLIDMNEVTLRSSVRSEAVPAGLAMDVAGTG